MITTPTATPRTAHNVRFHVSPFDTTQAPVCVSADQGPGRLYQSERAGVGHFRSLPSGI